MTELRDVSKLIQALMKKRNEFGTWRTVAEHAHISTNTLQKMRSGEWEDGIRRARDKKDGRAVTRYAEALGRICFFLKLDPEKTASELGFPNTSLVRGALLRSSRQQQEGMIEDEPISSEEFLQLAEIAEKMGGSITLRTTLSLLNEKRRNLS